MIAKFVVCTSVLLVTICSGPAYVVQPKCLLTAVPRYDINEMISAKTQLQLVQDEGQSHVMLDLDFKVSRRCGCNESGLVNTLTGNEPCQLLSLQGKDWNSQAKVGNGGFYGTPGCSFISFVEHT